MSRLAVQFLDQGLHRVLFDAMPLPVFVVDHDVNVLECNAALRPGCSSPADQPAQRRKAGDRVALSARDGIAERMRRRDGVFRLRIARGGARGFSRPVRDAPVGGDGTDAKRQARQGQSARQLPAVHLWQKLLCSAGPRRIEPLTGSGRDPVISRFPATPPREFPARSRRSRPESLFPPNGSVPENLSSRARQSAPRVPWENHKRRC